MDYRGVGCKRDWAPLVAFWKTESTNMFPWNAPFVKCTHAPSHAHPNSKPSIKSRWFQIKKCNLSPTQKKMRKKHIFTELIFIQSTSNLEDSICRCKKIRHCWIGIFMLLARNVTNARLSTVKNKNKRCLRNCFSITIAGDVGTRLYRLTILDVANAMTKHFVVGTLQHSNVNIWKK